MGETNQMKIQIDNFCALSHVEFTLNPGINVIAGKNGSGKSQLLMTIADQYGNQTLNHEGFKNISIKTVVITPKPKKVLWRPAIRKIGENARGQEYANLTPLSYVSTNYGPDYGYSYNVDERFQRLHDTITNLYIAGNLKTSAQEDVEVWSKIVSSFKKVFDKELAGEYKKEGGRVGLKLSSGVSAFHTLSTGELEFISLLRDLLTEPEVDLFLIDEIDAHFHPDLQYKLVSEINDIIQGKYLLLTTHSPSLMLSVEPQNLFYLRKSNEVKPGENQIICLSEDFKLMESVSEMYGGFVSDIRLANQYTQSASYDLIKYASECLEDSAVLGEEKSNDADPQTTSLRANLLGLPDNSKIIEIGAGRGRLLEAFSKINDEQLAKLNYVGIDCNADNLDDLNTFAEMLGIKSKFKSFETKIKIDGTDNFDLCILANVIHEVGPDELIKFFNDIIKVANQHSKIIILEILELAVGEKRFVMFDEKALNKIFENNTNSKKLSVSNAKPKSHSGNTLLEYYINILDNTASIDIDDIKQGLNTIVEATAKEIAGHIKEASLNTRSLAFKCHNLSNARAFIEILQAKQE